jgi:hypothetical protein
MDSSDKKDGNDEYYDCITPTIPSNSQNRIENSATFIATVIFDLQKSLWHILVAQKAKTAAAQTVAQSEMVDDLYACAPEVAKISLKICDQFTKEWNERIFKKADYYALSSAINSLAEWLSYSKGDEKVVHSAQMAASYCKLVSDHVSLEEAFNKLSIEVDKPPVEDLPIAAPSSSSKKEEAVVAKPLSVWKDTHKEAIKKCIVLITSGKYEGQKGTFVRWNGSTAYVRLGDLGDVGLTIQTKVKLLPQEK